MRNIKVTDVRVLPGDSAFLLDDGETAVLYDSGFAFTGFTVAENIKRELGARDLDYIFLTHSHYDHALGSVYALNYWPNAKVIASEYAARIFQKPSAKRFMREMDRKFADKCGVDGYEDLIDNLKVDISVKDGDIIDAGKMKFKVIELPGHTKCSIGFYLAENKLLLNSETLGVYNGENTVVPSCLVGYQMTMNSIEKVEKLEIENILLPHFGLLDNEKTRFYLQLAKKSTAETAEAIIGFAKTGKSNDEILECLRNKLYHGSVKEFYPKDAFELNTSIMIELIRRECS